MTDYLVLCGSRGGADGLFMGLSNYLIKHDILYASRPSHRAIRVFGSLTRKSVRIQFTPDPIQGAHCNRTVVSPEEVERFLAKEDISR